MSNPTPKHMFARIVVIILAMIPIVVSVIGTYTLLSGGQSTGIRFTDPSVHFFSQDFLSFYFAEYLPRLMQSIPVDIMLYSLYAPGIPLLLPILGVICIGGLASGISRTVAHYHLENRVARFLNLTLILLICFYILSALTHFAFSYTKEKAHSARVNEFNQSYTFDKLQASTTFVYFEWIAENGFYRKTKLTTSTLDGRNKKVLAEIPFLVKRGGAPISQFPSPRGTYYVASLNGYNTFEGYVSDASGNVIYTIPNPFFNYTEGVVQWSPNERYLAIFSSTSSYPVITGRLVVYDLKLKKQLSSFDGSNYGAFAWSNDDILYHPCGDHLCETRFADDAAPITETLPSTMSCAALVSLNDKIYCSVDVNTIEKTLGKKVAPPDMSFTDGRNLGNSYIISQEIAPNKSLSESVQVVTKIPLYLPKTLTVVDSKHIIATSDGGLYRMTVVNLESGRLMDLGSVKNNIFGPLVEHGNLGDLPIVYSGD